MWRRHCSRRVGECRSLSPTFQSCRLMEECFTPVAHATPVEIGQRPQQLPCVDLGLNMRHRLPLLRPHLYAPKICSTGTVICAYSRTVVAWCDRESLFRVCGKRELDGCGKRADAPPPVERVGHKVHDQIEHDVPRATSHALDKTRWRRGDSCRLESPPPSRSVEKADEADLWLIRLRLKRRGPAISPGIRGIPYFHAVQMCLCIH